MVKVWLRVKIRFAFCSLSFSHTEYIGLMPACGERVDVVFDSAPLDEAL